MRDRFTAAPGCTVPVSELRWRFSPSGGPGGQHANKSSTRVKLTFDIAGSPSLKDEERRRLQNRFGAELSLVVDESRSQNRNREVAIERLEHRLAAVFISNRRRRTTRPSRGANQRRLDEKRKRGQRKAGRRRPVAED